MLPHDIMKHDAGYAATWTGTDLSGEFNEEIFKKVEERYKVLKEIHIL